MDSTGKLVRWRLRHSKFKFDFVLCAGIRNQAADALSGNHFQPPRKNEDATFVYMAGSDAESDEGGVGLPGIYALAMEPGGNDKNDR